MHVTTSFLRQLCLTVHSRILQSSGFLRFFSPRDATVKGPVTRWTLAKFESVQHVTGPFTIASRGEKIAKIQNFAKFENEPLDAADTKSAWLRALCSELPNEVHQQIDKKSYLKGSSFFLAYTDRVGVFENKGHRSTRRTIIYKVYIHV